MLSDWCRFTEKLHKLEHVAVFNVLGRRWPSMTVIDRFCAMCLHVKGQWGIQKLFKKGQYLLGSWKLLPLLPIDVLNFKPPSGAGLASVNPAARLTLFRVIFKLQPGRPGDLDDLVTGNLFSLSPQLAHRYVQERQPALFVT
jgi:hypothetical protein